MTLTDASPGVADRVVLLDADRHPIGDEDRWSVHTTSTPLHLAFSIHLFDADDRVLLTRRALGKRTWPGVWTNSCCGHPRPGEPVEDAVRRRVGEELGLRVSELRCVLPDFAYTARDASGLEENEVCPVYVGRVVHPDGPRQPKQTAQPDDGLRPDPEEVMDWDWLGWGDLRAAVAAAPFLFSPWAVQQVGLLPEHPLSGRRPTAE